MTKNEKKFIYGLFFIIYLFLGYYNYKNNSQWILDNVLSLFFLTFIYSLTRFLKIHKPGFILFNLALLLHNLGTFGFYAWNYSWLGYDNIVHFFSSLVAGFIVFNFIARKMHIKNGEKIKNTVIDEHIVITIFLVISSVVLLGTLIELAEFFGYSFLGSGDGIFFVGDGDGVYENYVDTMTDIIINIIGSIVGVLIYYYRVYKKKPWIRI